MKTRIDKVIGYFATQKGTMNVACDGDACIITGTEGVLQRHISETGGYEPSAFQFMKTSYAEIVAGMRMGGVYAFDKGAYDRFLSVAKKEGMNLVEFNVGDDPKPHDQAIKLMRIKWFDMK